MGSAPPNVEAAIVAALRADAGVAAIVAQRVSSERPKDAVDPLLVVHRVGGSQTQDWIDGARIQIDAWGANWQSAWAAVSAACAALHRYRGTSTFAIVSGTERNLGPFRLADPATSRPRYIVEFTVYAHPLSA